VVSGTQEAPYRVGRCGWRFVDYQVDLGPRLYRWMIYFVSRARTSAVNLTDGMDGLAGGMRWRSCCSPTWGIKFLSGDFDLADDRMGALVAHCVGFL